MSIIECLARFQTAIVGIIGFTGVIVTLWWNARLARIQREETRRHEQESLASALWAELTIIRDSLVDGITTIGLATRDKSDGVLVPVDTMSKAFAALLGKIDRLPPDAIQKTLSAYLTFQTMKQNVRLLPGAVVRDELSMKVPRTSFEHFKAMSENILAPIDVALAALDALKSPR